MIGFLSVHPRRQCNAYVNTLRQVALLIVTGYAHTSWGVLGFEREKVSFPEIP